MYEESSSLGPFALMITRPTWIGAESPTRAEIWNEVWAAVGPFQVPIVGLRCGLLIFEFDKAPAYSGGEIPAYTMEDSVTKIPKHIWDAGKRREELAFSRISYMNAFLATLYSGYAVCEKTSLQVQSPVSLDNYYSASKIDDRWEPLIDLRANPAEFPLHRGRVLKLATLSYAIDVMLKCQTALGEQCIRILELIYIACHQYERHQFSSAHAIGWTIVESLVYLMWTRFRDEIDVTSGGHTSINKDRRKLLDGRDYTASVVIQVLSLANRIDDELLQRLDEARRTRNAFVHDLVPVQAQSASKVIRLATDLVAKIANVEFSSQLTYSYHL